MGMNMPTIEEIIHAKTVAKGDGYDITSVMNVVGSVELNWVFTERWEEYKGDKLSYNIKVDVQYDSRRGAQTGVLKYGNIPFAVISRAGRELGDSVSVYILDEEYASLAAMEVMQAPEFEENCKLDTVVNLNDWGGTVSLGDAGRKESQY